MWRQILLVKMQVKNVLNIPAFSFFIYIYFHNRPQAYFYAFIFLATYF